ncbi:MAG: DUF2889 domain-containing protein [Acidimicrobiia bacterium]
MRQVRVADRRGSYRRRIRLVSTEPGTVVGDLEDDFHRFRVTLRHGDGAVRSVRAESLRFPWSACPAAADPLHGLEGMTLATRFTAAMERLNPRRTCTHMFDLAALCITHAARETARRQYDLEVPPRDGHRIEPRLWRDGGLLLHFVLEERELVSPPPYSDVPWRGGFIQWADGALDPETAEAAIVLRRASEIGMGRGMDLDTLDTAESLLPIMSGSCFTMQPGVAEHATRNKVSIRDYGDDPDGLLHHDG